MSLDPTRIHLTTDPLTRRMTGVAAHGNIPFSVPFMTEIAPNLWQGGCEDGLILPGQIKHLVSLYPWESYAAKHELTTAVHIRMLDGLGEDMGLIEHAARWAAACRATGPVLIHCQAGLNRSSLVVARVLMLDGHTAAEAIALIRARRSPACLCNPAFEAWLLAGDGRAECEACHRRVLLNKDGSLRRHGRPWCPGSTMPADAVRGAETLAAAV